MAAGSPQSGSMYTRQSAAYTYGSACAANSADEIGTLSPGKFADICVLDHNIFEGEPEVILDTKNVFTMVNGRIVYEG